MKKFICLLIISMFIFNACSFGSKEGKFSTIIDTTMKQIDKDLAPTVEYGHVATKIEIEKIKLDLILANSLADRHKISELDNSFGAFQDLVDALNYWIDYLENNNADSFNKFNSIFGHAQVKIMRYSQQLKEKNL